MTQQTSSVADLDHLADKELARLARISQVDVRSELEQHVWPFFKELLALYESEEQDALPLPAETAGRVLGIITVLSQVAQHSLPPEHMQQIAPEIEAVVEEVLSLVDPDEWAAFIAQVPLPAAPAASPSIQQVQSAAEIPNEPAPLQASAPVPLASAVEAQS